MTNGLVATRTQSSPGVPAIMGGYTSIHRSSPSTWGGEGLRALARQFYRYGHNRARTIRKHPSSVSYRQLAVPALFVGLASPWRRSVLAAYAAVVLTRGALELVEDAPAVPTLIASFPTMHAAWGLGFVRGIAKEPGRPE